MLGKTYEVFNKKGAYELLESFSSHKLHLYSKLRNYDRGNTGENYVSYLSPLISRKILSEEDIVKFVLKKHSFNSTEKFISEIFWRSYWRGYLESHPQIFHNYQADLERTKKIKESVLYKKAISGTTNIECFNSWTKELMNTGYLHNHSRMWFASIWIFTLTLPWQLGAEYFLKHLLDGDVASNTLSWRWVAGLHTKGKHYVAFPRNIQKYTNNKFYPKNELSVNCTPITENVTYSSQPLEFVNRSNIKSYKSALLVHENDLSLKNTDNYDFIFIQKSPVNSSKRSKIIKSFISKCLSANFKDLSRDYPGKVFIFDLEDPNEFNELLIINDIKHLSVPYPYISDLKVKLDEFLNKVKIEANIFNSEWEKNVWPHCTKGFFQLKKNIPIILSRKINQL